MNKKVILAIICTLLIGFVLGFFLSGRLAHQRMRHQRMLMEMPKAERQHLAKKLELTEDQIGQISPILDSMLPQQLEIRKRHRAEMEVARKAMFEKIKPLLTEQQLKKLNHMIKRRKRHKAHQSERAIHN